MTTSSTSKHIVQPYLFFGGRCQEAIDHYKSAVGAQVDMLMHFDESPDPVPEGMLQPGFEKKVMHASFRIGDSVVMASDGCNEEETGFKGLALTLTVPSEAEADRAFNALAAGGKVIMALDKTFWSPRYGILEDKFGVNWMVMVPGPQP